MRRLLCCMALSALLGACTSEPVENSLNGLLSDSFSNIASGLTPAKKSSAPLITRAQIEAAKVPLLMIEVLENGSQATAVPIGQNGEAVTWITANGASIILKENLLFATRGLGPDLLTAETASATDALSEGGAGRYPRVYRFIAGDETVRKERYFCEMVNDGPAERVVVERRYATTQMRETCYALQGRREFQNLYWFGADGTLWDSVQWASRDAGYLQVQTLKR